MLSLLQVWRPIHLNCIQLADEVDPVGDGAMALYIYGVGAPFETILNNYMITSQAIHPPGVGSVSNGTLTGVTTNGSLELAWALQDT